MLNYNFRSIVGPSPGTVEVSRYRQWRHLENHNTRHHNNNQRHHTHVEECCVFCYGTPI